MLLNLIDLSSQLQLTIRSECVVQGIHGEKYGLIVIVNIWTSVLKRTVGN